MINTYIPYFKKKDEKNINQCLKKNYVSTAGPLIKEFEDKFCDTFKFNNAVALNSGTSALHLGLKALGVQESDLVILPSYTFAATANAVIYNNASPWFFDCGEDFLISLSDIEKTLKTETHIKKKKLIHNKTGSIVKAIIPVATFGKRLDFKKIHLFAKRYYLKLLFDVAACHDPKIFSFKKKKEMNFCFSFNGNKTLTTGAGGMFCSNSKHLIKKIRLFSNVGKFKKYDYQLVGYNYKMTNIQAALGISQLNNLKNILKIKQKIFLNYEKKLSQLRDFNIINSKKNINWVFVLVARSNKIFKKIQRKFQNTGIQLDFFWKPLHLQNPYKKYKQINLKFTNTIWKKVVVLPSHPGLKKNNQIKIIKNILGNFS